MNDELLQHWSKIPSSSLNPFYLKFIEDSKPLDLDFRYLVIEKKNGELTQLCGCLYFQILSTSTKNFSFGSNQILKLFSKLFFSLRSFKILVCGNLFTVNHPSIWFDKEKITLKEIINILGTSIQEFKSDVVILKDMDSEFMEKDMLHFGWKKYFDDLTMELTITDSWKSLDEYVNNLTKKYKKRAQKIILAGQDLVRKNLTADEIALQQKNIFKLFENVSKKQLVRMGLIRSAYFYEYKKRFPEKFSLTGYYFREELIAFSTFIERGEILEMHYIGIDYDYNKQYMLYFNILMDGIKEAIDKKKKILELGRTAKEAKANLGGIPVYFNDYYRTHGRFTSWLVDKIVTYCLTVMSREGIERNPIKK